MNRLVQIAAGSALAVFTAAAQDSGTTKEKALAEAKMRAEQVQMGGCLGLVDAGRLVLQPPVEPGQHRRVEGRAGSMEGALPAAFGKQSRRCASPVRKDGVVRHGR